MNEIIKKLYQVLNNMFCSKIKNKNNYSSVTELS